ncbi:hypothetical protein CCYA_CCYA17G4353 [Cyanidiococcus yangmingshanensis]|nr:hypothetical protein CCYA_CCYA17G4353 [Cyanidiococcus yangmingshanensis]
MHRKRKSNGHESESSNVSGTGKHHRQALAERLPKTGTGWLFALAWLCFAFVVFVAAQRWYHVPDALPTSASCALFSGERALAHVVQLAGPAVVGSRRVETNAAYIEGTLTRTLHTGGRGTCDPNQLSSEGTRALGLEATLERQFGNGSFELDFSQLGAQCITNTYTNISNIMLRLDPLVGNLSAERNETSTGCPDAIVVNSHFDTAPGSPGASDALTPIGVMLELVRLVVYRSAQHYATYGTSWLRAPLIFLFNGAEEAVLLGSHAFVANHPAINQTAMLVNLESAGAGIGPELLFRYDTRSPWLIRLYADTAPFPHTGCYVQDIFERNLIPAETDFRMFTETAGVTGVDLAFHMHGYTYHTRYDKPSRVDVRSIQHMGENVWALLQAALRERASEIRSAACELRQHRDAVRERVEPLVFFDLLSWKVVHFGHWIASRVYVLIAALLALLVWRPERGIQWYMGSKGMHSKTAVTSPIEVGPAPLTLYRALLALILGVCGGFLASLTVAFMLTSVLPGPRPPLLWYGRHMLVLPCLYGAPALASALTIAARVLSGSRNREGTNSASGLVLRYEQVERAVALYFMSLVLVLGLGLQLTMAYLWALQAGVHVLNSILFRPLRHYKRPGVVVFLRFFLFVVVPQFIHVPPVLTTLETFAPLMGMAGARAKVEFIVAALTAYLTMHWLFMLWLPLLSLHRSWMRGVTRLVVAIFLLAGALLLIPHWFGEVPYTPMAPKRLVVQNVCVQEPVSVPSSISRNAKVRSMNSANRTCLVGVAGLDPYPLERVLPKTRYSKCERNRFAWGYRDQRSIFANVAPLEALVRDAGLQCHPETLSAHRPWSLPVPRLDVTKDVRVHCTAPFQAIAGALNRSTPICRALTLQIQAPRAHWSAMICDAAVRQWSLTTSAPNQGKHRRHFIRHVAGHDTSHMWNVSFVLELDPDEPSVTIDLTSTRYGENQSELAPVFWSSSFPDWVSATYMTSAFASYVV